jgi:hypothetical protein
MVWKKGFGGFCYLEGQSGKNYKTDTEKVLSGAK